MNSSVLNAGSYTGSGTTNVPPHHGMMGGKKRTKKQLAAFKRHTRKVKSAYKKFIKLARKKM